jgi:putative holliday junction resolvase
MRRIGIASGQKITATATPLKTILAKQGVPTWSLLDRIIAEWNPAALIVGVPKDLNGNEQWVAKAARKFIASLQKRYQIPIFAANEQLTTKAAKERVYTAGGYKALQKEELDSIAAKLILEGWMDTLK